MKFLGEVETLKYGNHGKSSHKKYKAFNIRMNEKELKTISILTTMVMIPKGTVIFSDDIDLNSNIKSIKREIGKIHRQLYQNKD